MENKIASPRKKGEALCLTRLFSALAGAAVTFVEDQIIQIDPWITTVVHMLTPFRIFPKRYLTVYAPGRKKSDAFS